MREKYYFLYSLICLLIVMPTSFADTGSSNSQDCKVTISLSSDQWQLIGIPCEAPADANTVEDIFADDISGQYGTDWVIFSYSPHSNSYEELKLQDVPQVGKGYWIITLSASVQLDLPLGSYPANLTESTQCTSTACFESVIVSNNSKQWQLLANPFQYSFSWSAMRGKVATNDSPCGDSEGCTLAEMQTADFIENQGWHYDGTNYVPLKSTEISPWTGMWVVALDTANSDHAPMLLFPSIETDPVEGFFHLNFSASSIGKYDKNAIKRDWLGVLWANPNDRVNVMEENGNRFIRVEYPQGGVGPSEGGAQWKVDFMDAFGTTYNELYVSYKLRFANGFNPVKGGKLPGMYGGKGNTGGNSSDGYDGWSARMMWRPESASIFYVYHADMQGTYGDNFPWDNAGTPQQFSTDEWIQVEHRIVMNTPGKKNGVLQGWYNGVLVFDKQDMQYRHIDDFAIDGFYFSTFFGGSSAVWAPTQNEIIDFDDFIFSTSPISH
jgi:hypothetical protein